MFTFPAREEIPQKFWQSRCAFVRYTNRAFYGTEMDDKDAWAIDKVVPSPGPLLHFLSWWREQLGRYGASRGNGFEHNYKIAGCAYLLAQYVVFLKHPEEYWIDPPVVRKETEEERRERWLQSIRESAAKEAAEKEIRDAKIASGEIVLPMDNRPFELWIMVEGQRVRKTTQRNFPAIVRSALTVPVDEPYFIAHCEGDETRRRWVTRDERLYTQPVEWRN